MDFFRKTLAAGAMLLGSLGLALPASASTIVDLGFVFDRSGSISTSNYVSARNALADALGAIPFDNPEVTYRVGVVSFGSTALTMVAPTVIDSAAARATVQQTIRDASTRGGSTAMADGIDRIVADFAAAFDSLGDFSLINLMTDGAANVRRATGDRGANASEDTLLARDDAFDAGWDSLSVEAVGSGANSATSLAFLAQLAGPGDVQTLLATEVLDGTATLPNPLEDSFVLRVNDFDGFAPAIATKVGRIVEDTGGGDTGGGGTAPIPLPAAGWLLISAIGGLAVMRRRQRALAA